jgi:hypothetical protein
MTIVLQLMYDLRLLLGVLKPCHNKGAAHDMMLAR